MRELDPSRSKSRTLGGGAEVESGPVKQMHICKERQADRQTRSVNNRRAMASMSETRELLGLVERALVWRQARRYYFTGKEMST